MADRRDLVMYQNVLSENKGAMIAEFFRHSRAEILFQNPTPVCRLS
jgi:hypothetical protein